jgi:hypothetical protein
LGAPSGRVPFSLSRHKSSLNRNGRLGSGDPTMASSGRARGKRSAAKPFLLRQPYGERESSRQLMCGRLFTRPADQPRHATWQVHNPVDPGSPPFFVSSRPGGMRPGQAGWRGPSQAGAQVPGAEERVIGCYCASARGVRLWRIQSNRLKPPKENHRKMDKQSAPCRAHATCIRCRGLTRIAPRERDPGGRRGRGGGRR